MNYVRWKSDGILNVKYWCEAIYYSDDAIQLTCTKQEATVYYEIIIYSIQSWDVTPTIPCSATTTFILVDFSLTDFRPDSYLTYLRDRTECWFFSSFRTGRLETIVIYCLRYRKFQLLLRTFSLHSFHAGQLYKWIIINNVIITSLDWRITRRSGAYLNGNFRKYRINLTIYLILFTVNMSYISLLNLKCAMFRKRKLTVAVKQVLLAGAQFEIIHSNWLCADDVVCRHELIYIYI